MTNYDVLVKVVKSTKPEKDYMAVFKDSKTGRTKTTHFGDSSMDHYNIHKNKQRKKNYRSRHAKDLNTNDPTAPGYLSYYLLWGDSTSLRENVAAYKKRFFPKSTSPRRMKSPTCSAKKIMSPKPSPKKGLQRWFAEEWVDEYGNVCGSSKNKNTKKCRPKKRITEDTPVTWGEMTPSQKRKAVAEKKKVGMGAKASPVRKKKLSSPVSSDRIMYEETEELKREDNHYPRIIKKKSPRKKKSPKKLGSPSGGKPVPANPALYAKVKAEAKSRFKVWPSAYGSGWLVRTYKERGGTYK